LNVVSGDESRGLEDVSCEDVTEVGRVVDGVVVAADLHAWTLLIHHGAIIAVLSFANAQTVGSRRQVQRRLVVS